MLLVSIVFVGFVLEVKVVLRGGSRQGGGEVAAR